jgi:hypothetical protein
MDSAPRESLERHLDRVADKVDRLARPLSREKERVA